MFKSYTKGVLALAVCSHTGLKIVKQQDYMHECIPHFDHFCMPSSLLESIGPWLYTC